MSKITLDPPQAQQSEGAPNQGEELARRLFENFRNGKDIAAGLRLNAYVADVTVNLSLIRDLVTVARQIKKPLPCLLVENRKIIISPEHWDVSLWSLLSTVINDRRAKNILLRTYLKQVHRKGYKHEKFIFGQAEELLNHCESALGEFLSCRLDAGSPPSRSGKLFSGLPIPSSSSSSPYLNVEIFTSSSGFQLEYSPQYIARWIIFGAPTSPVKNSILAGRYLFRSKDSSGTYLYEHTPLDVIKDVSTTLISL